MTTLSYIVKRNGSDSYVDRNFYGMCCVLACRHCSCGDFTYIKCNLLLPLQCVQTSKMVVCFIIYKYYCGMYAYTLCEAFFKWWNDCKYSVAYLSYLKYERVVVYYSRRQLQQCVGSKQQEIICAIYNADVKSFGPFFFVTIDLSLFENI